jgi:hypothetical protein
MQVADDSANSRFAAGNHSAKGWALRRACDSIFTYLFLGIRTLCDSGDSMYCCDSMLATQCLRLNRITRRPHNMFPIWVKVFDFYVHSISDLRHQTRRQSGPFFHASSESGPCPSEFIRIRHANEAPSTTWPRLRSTMLRLDILHSDLRSCSGSHLCRINPTLSDSYTDQLHTRLDSLVSTTQRLTAPQPRSMAWVACSGTTGNPRHLCSLHVQLSGEDLWIPLLMRVVVRNLCEYRRKIAAELNAAACFPHGVACCC